MPHLTKQDLADYALRDEFALTDARRSGIETHLRSCADCSGLLKTMENRAAEITHADSHFDKLMRRAIPRRRLFLDWNWPARIAAMLAVCLLGYGTLVYVVNYRFDHGPMGLAEFQADYEFAIKPSVTRGNEKEPEDIRLFKEGVRALFEAKQTTLGLFPSYDPERLKSAESQFNEVLGTTSDQDLQVRITVLLTKVRELRMKQNKSLRID